MDLKSIVQTGMRSKPPRIILHGIHGIGKSSFGAGAYTPIFLQTEDGLTEIDVPHFPLATSYSQVIQYLDMIFNETHEYKTLVIDTLDWLEKLIWNKICEDCNIKSPEDLGYGKAYTLAMRYWHEIILKLDTIRNKGIIILLLSHNEIKPFNPPDGDSYDRYQIKLNKQAATAIEEWADCVLFADFVTYTSKNKQGKIKAVGSGERVIKTSINPAWRTKTRYKLPDQMPLNFDNLIQEIKKSKNN